MRHVRAGRWLAGGAVGRLASNIGLPIPGRTPRMAAFMVALMTGLLAPLTLVDGALAEEASVTTGQASPPQAANAVRPTSSTDKVPDQGQAAEQEEVPFTPPPLTEPGVGPCLVAEFVYPAKGRPTPECHASTIVETTAGTLIAAWFGGTYEKHPDVGIWVARRSAQGWSSPQEVATGQEGEQQDFACWNPVLFQPTAGPLLLFYKVGPSPRDWWGMVMTSTDDGQTWSAPRRLGTNARLGETHPHLLGPVKNKPIQLASGDLLCPSSSEHVGWRVHLEHSKDLGATWDVVGPLDDPEQLQPIQPSLLTYADGRMQLLCRSKAGVVAQSWSRDGGATWSSLSATALPNPNSGTDAVTLADGRQLLVYNHTRRSPQNNGRQMLNVALSRDGETWVAVLTLENEGNENGYSYPAVIQTRDGHVHITYTWRRELVKHVVLDASQIKALQ